MALGKNYQSLLLVIAGVAVLALLISAVVRSSAFGRLSSPASGAKQVFFGETAVDVEIASSPQAREHGLSGRTGLGAGKGLLFIFENDGNWGIWMKGMTFSIDIIWVDSAGRVVTVQPSVSPDTYPKVFYPSLPARYVLEVPAGFARTNSIYEGARMTFATSTPR